MFTQTRLSYLFYTFYNGARLSITLLYKYTRVFKIFWQKEKKKKINRVILRQVQSIRGGRIYVGMHPLASKETECIFVAPC